jgi:hypothetical protein
MQTRSILGAAGVIACLSGAPAIAEDSKFAEDGMARNSKRDIDHTARNTRPAKDHHKDARKCLDMGKNEDVIKCARKYK